jgi:hypothetical protein
MHIKSLFLALALCMRKKIQKNIIDWLIVFYSEEDSIRKGVFQEDIAVHLNLYTGFIGQVESPNFI